MTPQPSAEKMADQNHRLASSPGLQLATCTVWVWCVCNSEGCMPTLLAELWRYKTKKKTKKHFNTDFFTFAALQSVFLCTKHTCT